MTDRRDLDKTEPVNPLKLSDFNMADEVLRGGAQIRRPVLPSELNAKGTERQPAEDAARFPESYYRGKNNPWYPIDTPPKRDQDQLPKGTLPRLDREDRPGGWGVHYFDNKDVPDRRIPRPPKPEEKPDTRNDGGITSPDTIQTPFISDTDARNSVYINADARSLYATGAITGAAINGGTHAMDRYTGAIAPEARTGVAAFWRDNLSPSQRAVPERRVVFNHIDTQILPQAQIEATTRASTFARHAGFRTDLQSRLVSEIPTGPISDLERRFFDARVEIVRNDALFSRTNIIANAGTPEQVALRQRLFTTHDATQLATQADDYWMATQANLNARTGLAEAQASRHAALARLTQAERGSITTATGALLQGAGRGLLVTTGVVAADMVLDKALGNDPSLSNSAHWGLQGIGMPVLLASNLSVTGKVIGSVGMVLGSHALDKAWGPPTGSFSPFARPSLPEIGLATAGALTPVADGRVRLALAAGGYALGKTWNYLDAKYELTGRTEPRLRDEAEAAVDYDMKSPSQARFMFAAGEMKKFADKNEAAAAVLIKNWTLDHREGFAIEKERSSAALMLGFGESVLERGTRVDQDKFDKDGVRILAGMDYDLGGESANYFRATLGNLQTAERLAQSNKGRRITGGVIDDSYIADLQAAQQHTRRNLDRIYADHNIAEVYTQVTKALSSHPDQMRKFGENLAEYSKVLTDTDPKYKAKILRDLALVHVAFGDKEPSIGGSREHYVNAQKYLDSSRLLDETSTDRAQIERLILRAR